MKKLQGRAGFTMVMHTHSRKLDFHPHIHVVMPGASINKKTRVWKVKATDPVGNGSLRSKNAIFITKYQLSQGNLIRIATPGRNNLLLRLSTLSFLPQQ